MFHSMMTYYDILYDTAVWYSWIELFRIRDTHERKRKEKEKILKITKNIRERVGKKLKEENALSIVRQDHNE